MVMLCLTDLEWALENDKTYFLRARPSTGLKDEDEGRVLSTASPQTKDLL